MRNFSSTSCIPISVQCLHGIHFNSYPLFLLLVIVEGNNYDLNTIPHFCFYLPQPFHSSHFLVPINNINRYIFSIVYCIRKWLPVLQFPWVEAGLRIIFYPLLARCFFFFVTLILRDSTKPVQGGRTQAQFSK